MIRALADGIEHILGFLAASQADVDLYREFIRFTIGRLSDDLLCAVADQHEMGLDERRDFGLQLLVPGPGFDLRNK